MATVGMVAVLATGCEWVVGEQGITYIGYVEGAVTFPLIVDPTDTAVPPGLASNLLDEEDAKWDGQPFSWQCYSEIFDVPNPGFPFPTAKVEQLGVVLSAGAGDFAHVRVEWDAVGLPDVEETCSSDPGFVPFGRSGGLPSLSPHGTCVGGVELNGTLQGDWGPEVQGGFGHPTGLGMRFDQGGGLSTDYRSFEFTAGPLVDGINTVDLVSPMCTGMQFNDGGRLVFIVDHIEASAKGTTP